STVKASEPRTRVRSRRCGGTSVTCRCSDTRPGSHHSGDRLRSAKSITRVMGPTPSKKTPEAIDKLLYIPLTFGADFQGFPRLSRSAPIEYNYGRRRASLAGESVKNQRENGMKRYACVLSLAIAGAIAFSASISLAQDTKKPDDKPKPAVKPDDK